MNVEDSYEGAVRRLNRLGRAGIDLAPPPARSHEDNESDRMRDLEELATLACDENERLKQELAGACSENQRLTREMRGARGEIDRLQRLTATLQEMLKSAQSDEPGAASDESERLSHELVGARGEIARLQQLVTMLQETLAGGQADDESLNVPKKSRAALYFFGVVTVAAAAGFLLVSRPWERRPVVVLPSAPVVAASAPAVVEPIAPKVEPIIPKAEPIVPKVAVTVPKVEPVKVAAAKPARRHAPKHAAPKSAKHKQPRKHSSVAKSKLEPRGDDPLGGLNM